MKIPTTLAALVAAIALAGCGSSTPATVTVTQTVTTSTAPTFTATTSTTGSATSTSTSSSTTSSAAATSAITTTSTSTTTTTRTETAPAFVGTNPTSSAAIGHDLAAAIAVLGRSGYQPVSTATYDANNTLRVLIGREPGTSNEKAFFFDQTIYLGTDTSAPSERISVISQNDTEVTLGYAIYASGASAPSGQRRVQFALDMGQLSALTPIPDVGVRR